MKETRFEFEKLEVYRLALELSASVQTICDQLPQGYGDLRSQLLRAARSVHLNIAEGAGKYRAGAKAERYVTARASANESAAALVEIRMFGLAERQRVQQARQLLHRICAMLTRLILRWDPKA